MIRAVVAGLCLGATIALGSTTADALPTVGERRPDAAVEDADGRLLRLASLAGKPTLILYEDKGSAALNQPFKDELSQFGRGDRYRDRVALLPVADVGGYDFWPVKGFVRDAVRGESKRMGATIYCDFSGDFARSLRLRHGTSSVVLVGRDGRVLFAREGALSKEDRAAVLGLLRAELSAAHVSPPAAR